ncbi:MAG: DUF2062 domain-containing protein [Deltaproteobacteria bacterium]|nr:DUF2062 domain-containing protein [Deltaproteobacteria bacterium]
MNSHSPLQKHDDGDYPEWPNPRRDSVKKFARYFYDRFIRLHGSPEEVAWGAAIGFFVAMTPTMGIQTYLAVPIAAVFRISKVAAALTVWLTNPVTAPIIYGFNYMAGAKLLGYPLNAPFFSNPSWQTLWYSGRRDPDRHGGGHSRLFLDLGDGQGWPRKSPPTKTFTEKKENDALIERFSIDVLIRCFCFFVVFD